MFTAACLVLLFVFSSGAFLGRTASAAAPVVLYVSPTGSDTTGNGSLATPYATIPYAVSLAPTGASVIVLPGTYDETVMITKPLTLESQSLQPSNTIINAIGQPNGIVVVGSAAAGTVIQGLTVENANNHGIYAQDSSQVAIQNNVVTNNGLNIIPTLGEDKAIELTGTSNSTVADNTATGNHYGGIGISDDGPDNPSWNSTAVPSAGIPSGSANPAIGNVISGNSVIENQPNHCAIVVSASNAGEGVLNNIVSNNIVVDNTAGIIVAANTPNTYAINNSVISNTILNNGEAGVVIHSNAPGDRVSGNIISGNMISGDGSGPQPPGIIVGGEGSVAAVNTVITGNTFHNEYYGILIVNANETSVDRNTMDSTVQVPINGTVVSISSVTTVAQITTVAQTTTVAQITTVAQTTTVAQITTVAQTTTVAQITTVAQTTTIAQSTSSDQTGLIVGSIGVVIAIIAIGVSVMALRRRPTKQAA